jgi:septum site-determining protein MinC
MAKPAKGACELKSGQFQFMRLALYANDWNAVQAWVADHLSQAPDLFAQAPIALDCSKLKSRPNLESLEDLLHRLRYAGVTPVALVAEADSADAELARALKLAVLAPETRASKVSAEPDFSQAAANAPEPALEPAAEPAPKAAEPAPAKVEIRTETKIVKQIEQVVVDGVLPPQQYQGPVRSGQQLYAKGRDLIVTGGSAPGSEVIADGSIHLYGRLMGKVIAGASGNREAKIYCLAFGAELVSIAGIFRVFEAVPRDLAGRAVQIFLQGDKLQIEPL